jgi:hypothetical protein
MNLPHTCYICTDKKKGGTKKKTNKPQVKTLPSILNCFSFLPTSLLPLYYTILIFSSAFFLTTFFTFPLQPLPNIAVFSFSLTIARCLCYCSSAVESCTFFIPPVTRKSACISKNIYRTKKFWKRCCTVKWNIFYAQCTFPVAYSLWYNSYMTTIRVW